jgi:LEA14-like dessication related protein
LAVPCAVSDGRYREKEGLSIMGVIDFGVVQVGTTRLKRIAVRNPNPVPVAIVGVTSTVRAVTVARVEITASAVSAPVYASSVSALRVSLLAAGGVRAELFVR